MSGRLPEPDEPDDRRAGLGIEKIAGLAPERQNFTMRALIVKVLIGVAIGLAIVLVFVLFAHPTIPV